MRRPFRPLTLRTAMTRLVLILSVLLSACPMAPAERPSDTAGSAPEEQAEARDDAPAAREPVLVVDGRDIAEQDVDGAWERAPAVAAALGAARRHWESQNDDVSWAPGVAGVARGAFTQPGADQTAVLYTVGWSGHCCTFGGLAIVQDGRLVRNVALAYGGFGLRALPDVDGDGRDEVVFVGGGTGQGHTETSVFIEEVAEAGMERWGQAVVYEDDCGMDGSGASATRLTVEPGPTPAFFAERFENGGACAGAGAWTPAGPRASVTLDEPFGDAGVDLPVR